MWKLLTNNVEVCETFNYWLLQVINAMGVQEVIRLTISNKRATGVVSSLFYCYP
jgi:hypothetical protein